MRKSLLIVVLAILTAIVSSWAPGAVAIGVLLAAGVAFGVAVAAIMVGVSVLTGRAHVQRHHAPI